MIDRETLYKGLNDAVLGERLHAFGRNLGKNIPLIRKYGGLRDLVARFEGKHVILAAAGPSLDKNLSHLSKYAQRENIIIASVDMALRPLAAGGIVPAYVFSCETVPTDFFRGIDTGRMHLLAFSCMSNANLRNWKGPISFYNWMVFGEGYDELWERAGKDLGFVATGNIVTTQAVSFFLGCGIESLALVGNDLGFSRSYYARGAAGFTGFFSGNDRLETPERKEAGIIRSRRCYEIRRGGTVFFTDRQFLAAKMWLEDIFKSAVLPVYDCSEPGCSEKYLIKIQLRDYLKRFDRTKRRKR